MTDEDATDQDEQPANWRGQHPVLAGLAVALLTYLASGVVLLVFGRAEPPVAFGVPTAGIAAAMWFVGWAVFTRHRTDLGRRERAERRDDDSHTL